MASLLPPLGWYSACAADGWGVYARHIGATICGNPPSCSCGILRCQQVTIDDGEGQVAEHASRVRFSPRISTELPARLWIRRPVPPRPDHGMEPAQDLLMLSKGCSGQHARIYSRRRVRVCCPLRPLCGISVGSHLLRTTYREVTVRLPSCVATGETRVTDRAASRRLRR